MPTPNQRAAQMDGIYMDQPVIYKHSTCYPIVNIGEINYGDPHRYRETHSDARGATQISMPPQSAEHAQIIKQHEEMLKLLQQKKISGLSGVEIPSSRYSVKSLIIIGIGMTLIGTVASSMIFGKK